MMTMMMVLAPNGQAVGFFFSSQASEPICLARHTKAKWICQLRIYLLPCSVIDHFSWNEAEAEDEEERSTKELHSPDHDRASLTIVR